ncbi:hypothetical protein LXA43DRAFT_310147 [Ganoderma leucocontextum]|nr:hypothetical protein LXA43DRAFT_310147 [Ganoderma leucocontextum]
MSTAEPSPIRVPMDDSLPSDPQPLESEKTRVALTPPPTLALLVEDQLSLQDGAAQTFIVDLAVLGGGPSGESDDECKSSPVVGEHKLDDMDPPPSPQELPEKIPLPPLSVDVVPAGTSSSSDSTSTESPIEPPGLSRPIDDAPVNDAAVKADEVVLSDVENGDVGGTASSCWSLSGLETLRTFIPDDLLPDDLWVYDAHNVTTLSTYLPESGDTVTMPVHYVRILPERSPAAHPSRNVAYLYLATGNKLGGGNNASAYSAPFSLRLDAESDEESTVRVAVKTALARCGAHEMLRREAVAYNEFPRHLMEDRYPTESPQTVASATAALTSDDVAQPDTDLEPGPDATTPTSTASDDASPDGADKRTPTPTHQPAVVPKFFGHYAAVDADGSVIEHSHPSCDIDEVCAVTTWPTRLLLMEECGKPVVPEERPLEERSCCLDLFKRLHAEGFVQGSVFPRNILIQPGPLSAPPEERTDGTPSFRIIDFGRVQMPADFSPESEGFANARDTEEKSAYAVLVELDDRSCW